MIGRFSTFDHRNLHARELAHLSSMRSLVLVLILSGLFWVALAAWFLVIALGHITKTSEERPIPTTSKAAPST